MEHLDNLYCLQLGPGGMILAVPNTGTPAAQEAAELLPEGGLAAVAATIKHGLHVHLVAGALTPDTEAAMRRLHGSLCAAAADGH